MKIKIAKVLQSLEVYKYLQYLLMNDINNSLALILLYLSIQAAEIKQDLDKKNKISIKNDHTS